MLDTDGDGYSDGLEVLVLETNPLDPNDPSSAIDKDGDGLPEGWDPDDTNPDTDGDGFLDFYEAVYGSDMLDPNSRPQLGDVNGDGRTNNLDAIMIFNLILGNLTTLPHVGHADVQPNGYLNNIDAVGLYFWTLGNQPHIPIL